MVWSGWETKNSCIIKYSKKLISGFDCIKIKIGALDFKTEIDLLKNVRKEFSTKDVEIRVDANCAFSFNSALEKLKILSDFSLHSIEQPIQIRQWENMAYLCENSPLDIALDEELVGLPCEDKEAYDLDNKSKIYYFKTKLNWRDTTIRKMDFIS